MRLLAWPAALVLLSGCVAQANPGEPPAPDLPPEDEPKHDILASACGSTFWYGYENRVIPVNFTGNLGTRIAVCAYEASGACHTQAVTNNGSELIIKSEATGLLSVNLTLTWAASTVANDVLTFGIMIMGENSTYLGNVSGTSPLALLLEGGHATISPDHVVRAFVRNELLNLHSEQVGLDGAADDPFRIQGKLVVEEAHGSTYPPELSN